MIFLYMLEDLPNVFQHKPPPWIDFYVLTTGSNNFNETTTQ